jgi:hypothetical protein
MHLQTVSLVSCLSSFSNFMHQKPMLMASLGILSFFSLVFYVWWEKHGHMVRDGHGLPKVSPEPVMPYPSITSRRATPETPLWLFQFGPLAGQAACRHLPPLWTAHTICLWGEEISCLSFQIPADENRDEASLNFFHSIRRGV